MAKELSIGQFAFAHDVPPCMALGPKDLKPLDRQLSGIQPADDSFYYSTSIKEMQIIYVIEFAERKTHISNGT